MSITFAAKRGQTRSKQNEHGTSTDKRLRLLIVTLIVMLIIALGSNLVFTLTQARETILQAQFTTSEKLVRVLEQQTVDSVNALELALQSAAAGFQSMPPGETERDAAVHRMLTASIRNLPFVRAIWILDPEGNMIHDSERLPGKYNLSDREYFQVQKAAPQAGLYIEGPLKSKHGVWFIAASVGIKGADGRFGGVVAAAFDPKHFEQYYNSIKPGETGVVALLRRNGAIVLRVPGRSAVSGEQFEQARTETPATVNMVDGTYKTRSDIDGIERIYSYRRIPGRPLAVLVGIGEQEVLAPWRRMVSGYTAVSAIFLLALGCLGYVALRELRRRSSLHDILVQSESDLAAAQRLSKTGSWTFEFSRNIGKWSSEMYSILGLEKLEKAGTVPPLSEFLLRIHPEDRKRLEQTLFHQASWSMELRTNPEQGSIRYLLSQGEAVVDAADKVIGKTGTLQDITERYVKDEKLRLAACVFDRMQDGIVVTDLQGRIITINRACEQITEYREADVVGSRADILLSEQKIPAAEILGSIQAHGEWRGEIWGRTRSGASYPLWLTVSAIHDNQRRQTGYVGVFTDLSDIKQANDQLRFLSFHDPLTHLPNRRLILDRLQKEIDHARPDGSVTAALILNLDRLQRVNDTFGHDTGNAVLAEISRRLPGALSQKDSVGRAIGDEFIVVLAQVRDAGEIITFAHRLLELIAKPIDVNGSSLSITASMGIAVFPTDGATAEELLKNGATALSHAKQRGPNAMRFFTGEMNVQAVRWTGIEQELRRARLGEDITLHYQPQVCLAEGRVCGAEALMRWNSRELGSVSPAEFIPVAEDAGLIDMLGEWAIHEACRQARAWQDKGIRLQTIAVNVSSHQFSSGRLLDIVKQALTSNEVEPRLLEMEMTETALMKESDVVYQQVSALRRLGVRVSLDDFGTGYSSLSYLSKFAFDKIKIDQSFVRSVTFDKKSEAIAMATMALAQSLGMDVIAEGVETIDQLRWLMATGCSEVQGYLISKPVPPETFEDICLSFHLGSIAI